MSSDDVRRRVEARMDAISVGLFEGVTTGVASARSMLKALPHQHEYPHLLPLAARAFMREHWLAEGLGPDWSIAGNPRLMGQTLLSNHGENLELRLLKERRRSYPGGVPIAGSNQERRGAWRQPALDLSISGHPILAGSLRLLALWDLQQLEDQSVVTLRVVHTLSPGVYGSRVPLDMNYEIQPSGGIFDNLRFRGDPQEHDLYAEIDREENEGDGAV